MKVLLIDPEEKTITEIQISKGLDPIYKAIGCDMFECPIQYENQDTLYCDEESWLKYDGHEKGFAFPNWKSPILGKALIMGCDDEGESEDCKSTPKDFSNIIWINEVDIKIYGKLTGLIYEDV